MAHEVESLAYVGETPWHRIGTKVDGPMSGEQALTLGGLDWTVSTRDVFLSDGRSVPNARAVVRDSDGAILGSVGSSWTALQNAEAVKLAEPFVSAGLASWDCVASLRGGARVFFLLRIGGQASDILPGDSVERFLLVSNGHDGTMSARIGFTGIRTVCANTLAQAHASKSSKLIRARHTAGIVATMEKVRDVMNLANSEFEASAEQYRALARRQISKADLAAYVRQVFPAQSAKVSKAAKVAHASAPIAAPAFSGGGIDALFSAIDLPLSAQPSRDDASMIAEAGAEILERITEYVETGVGSDIPGVRGSMWGAYNAVSEYLGAGRSHRNQTDDRKLDSLWFGDAATVNARALVAAIAMSGGRMTV